VSERELNPSPLSLKSREILLSSATKADSQFEYETFVPFDLLSRFHISGRQTITKPRGAAT